MSESSPISRRLPFPAGPAAAAALLEPLLAEVAGEGAAPVTLALDYGAPAAAGETLLVEAWVDRATRTLVFAQARATGESGAMAVTGSAVFRRPAPPRRDDAAPT